MGAGTAMRSEIFPKRKQDGSFCIEMRLAIDAEDPAVLATRINAWIEEWVQANRYWKTVFAEESGVFDFYDEFARPPYCVMGDSRSLFLRVEGGPRAKKWWKDWIASRLMPDLKAAFKEVQPRPMEKARNCSEDS
jgi:hypothetical protein